MNSCPSLENLSDHMHVSYQGVWVKGQGLGYITPLHTLVPEPGTEGGISLKSSLTLQVDKAEDRHQALNLNSDIQS